MELIYGAEKLFSVLPLRGRKRRNPTEETGGGCVERSYTSPPRKPSERRILGTGQKNYAGHDLQASKGR